MKKSLVLAALAATVAAPAFAQSSVTIYGRLNVTLERNKPVGADSDYSVNNNGSRLGFKGVEDLGGGLKAGFALEHRFDPTTGTANAPFWGGAGQSEVNLSGNFGMLRLGLFTAESYFATSDWIDMHNHGTGDSADALYVGYGAVGNKVAYRTPTMGSFWAEASVAESDAASPDDRYYDLAANFDVGPLKMGAGFSKAGDAKQFAVRALYEFGAFTVGGYYQRHTDQFAGLGLDGSANNFRLAGMYTMGATELHLNYGQVGDIGDNSGTKAKQATAGINYNLSKRTKVYGYYTKLGGAGADLYGGAASHWALGVRHNF